MAHWLLVAYLALAGMAILQGVLVAVQTWEHHRFAFSRLSRVSQYRQSGRAVLIVPCKGFDVGIESNLGSFFRLDYHNYELRFVVESDRDPVCPVIRRLMARYAHVEARVIVAGEARDCGQKVHNLRAATADLGEDVRFLAFADSDARVRRPWLRGLLARLDEPDVGATTGYRWFVPARPSLANVLLHSINAGIAVFFGAKPPTVVWGGSWAMRREMFDALALRDAWAGTLSDDLVASRLLQQARLRVLFEPVCMVISPLDTTLRGLCSFVRRQYLMGRFYLPVWWAGVIVLVSLSNLVFFGSVVAAVAGFATGARFAGTAAAVASVQYLVGVIGGLLRQHLVLTYFPRLRSWLRAARRFEVWAGPLVALVNWIMLLGSVVGTRLTWRGITYQVGRRGQVEAVWREAAPEGPEAPLPAEETPAPADTGDVPIILPLPNRDLEADPTAAMPRRLRCA
jgi:hypothetical protein